MSKASLSLMTLTVIAGAALAAGRCVKQDGTYPAAGGLSFGITRSDAAVGDPTPVDVHGTALAEAGAAFAVDVPLMVGTNGKVIAHDGAGAKHAIGRSMSASAGDGAQVEILLVPSSGLAVSAA
jgi:hypothetical protein